jgi:hypothetical protein
LGAGASNGPSAKEAEAWWSIGRTRHGGKGWCILVVRDALIVPYLDIDIHIAMTSLVQTTHTTELVVATNYIYCTGLCAYLL